MSYQGRRKRALKDLRTELGELKRRQKQVEIEITTHATVERIEQQKSGSTSRGETIRQILSKKKYAKLSEREKRFVQNFCGTSDQKWFWANLERDLAMYRYKHQGTVHNACADCYDLFNKHGLW